MKKKGLLFKGIVVGLAMFITIGGTNSFNQVEVFNFSNKKDIVEEQTQDMDSEKAGKNESVDEEVIQLEVYSENDKLDWVYDNQGFATNSEGVLLHYNPTVTNKTEITIPSNIKYIYAYAFSDCEQIVKVNLNNGLLAIGEGAFSECKNLETINIPTTVERIEEGAFLDCIKLKNLTISPNLTDIGNGAFFFCNELSDDNGFVIINNILCDYIEEKNKFKIDELVIPQGVKTTHTKIFYDNSNIKKIGIPDSVINLGEEAFFICENLEKVSIPSSVINVNTSISVGCNKLSINCIKNSSIYNDAVLQEFPITHPSNVNVSYKTHIQNVGWQDYKTNGQMSGTTGQSLRLEGINIKVEGNTDLGIQYTTHVQDYGWLPWASNNQMSGTEGESKRLEAIKINLIGVDAGLYDVYYRVHAQDYGWLDWAKNGQASGTAGFAKRLEGIEVKVLVKGSPAPGVTTKPYVANGGSDIVKGNNLPNISYQTHVENIGWQGYKYNQQQSGTSGQALRLEAIRINLTNQKFSGSVQYQTHVQNVGWQDWKIDGADSGTSGQALRLEAIKIELTNEMAQYYDIYYRVHAQDYGWLGWAKNGQASGTEGYAKRLEAIEVVLVVKGGAAPGSTSGAFRKK